MKPLLLLTLCGLTATLFFSCKSDTKPPVTSPNSPETAATTTATATPKPEVYLYSAKVDKLNLRDQPNKSAQVLAQFAEGEIIEGTGTLSANKEEAVLRGISWTEPYHEVKNPKGNGQPTGWAHGGALQPIYAGSRANLPDVSKLNQLSAALKALNTKKLDSGKKAWDFVKTNFTTVSGSTADAAFIMLERFLNRMEFEGEYYKMTESIQWKDEDYEAIYNRTFDTNKHPATKSLVENGFVITVGEGSVFPVVDWNKLQAFFSSKATPSMKAYIEQGAQDRNDPPWSDGGIIISLEELADRGAWWERFNLDNPYFPLRNETAESERWPRLVLVNGSDNTPIYDYESQAITEEVKKAWAYIQQKYPGTKLAAATKEIADLCAAEGWKRTKKVEEFQAKFAEAMYQ